MVMTYRVMAYIVMASKSYDQALTRTRLFVAQWKDSRGCSRTLHTPDEVVFVGAITIWAITIWALTMQAISL